MVGPISGTVEVLGSEFERRVPGTMSTLVKFKLKILIEKTCGLAYMGILQLESCVMLQCQGEEL